LRSHLRHARTTDASRRARQTGGCLAHWSHGQASSTWHTHTRTCSSRFFFVLGGRLAFDSERHNRLATQDDQTQCAPLLLLFALAATHGNAAEFFAIAQHNVHVLVKCHELAHHLPPVRNRYPHPVVYKLQDFGAFRHSLSHGCELFLSPPAAPMRIPCVCPCACRQQEGTGAHAHTTQTRPQHIMKYTHNA